MLLANAAVAGFSYDTALALLQTYKQLVPNDAIAYLAEAAAAATYLHAKAVNTPNTQFIRAVDAFQQYLRLRAPHMWCGSAPIALPPSPADLAALPSIADPITHPSPPFVPRQQSYGTASLRSSTSAFAHRLSVCIR